MRSSRHCLVAGKSRFAARMSETSSVESIRQTVGGYQQQTCGRGGGRSNTAAEEDAGSAR